MEKKSELKKCCGNCRLFDWFGKRNDKGERVGYCPEFAAAGEILESYCCHPSDPFRAKEDKGGEA